MFKTHAKDEKKDKLEEKEKDKDRKEDRRKEKERQRQEKKLETDKKRATTTIRPSKDERSLSSQGLSDSTKPSSPLASPVVSPRSGSRATMNADQLALEYRDEHEKELKKERDAKRTSTETSHTLTLNSSQALSPPINSSPPTAHPALGSHAPPVPSLNTSRIPSSSPLEKSSENLSRGNSDKQGQQDNTSALKNKIAHLPPDTKQLVEYLLNIFSRTLPDRWAAPPNLEHPTLDDQIDSTIDKLIEASEILFNKDAPSLLKRYGKDLRESPNRRADKWRSIGNMLGSDDPQFTSLFLTSDALDSVVISALSRPLETEETEILAELLKQSVIRDVSLKELLAVVQAASKSNAHVKNSLDENRSLSDAIVELVSSFKKLSRAAEEEFQVQDLKKDADISESLNQSVSLLEHANTIKHAKGGNDILHPLESFFQSQISAEIEEGEKWNKTNEDAKEEKTAKLHEIDEFISEEAGKLKNVQANIAELEAKLEQKKAEEKILQESLALKVKEREQYLKEREQTEMEIAARIDETAQHLDHHKKAEETVTKFSHDVTGVLDKEVNETLKKTKEVLHELDKEVTFLEEKLVTYERSMSLFNNADEPEVLDGLRKLFTRCTAIYAESKQSVLRVSGVVELLRTVLGEDSTAVEEIAKNLEKITNRQTTLNNKYKLRKE